MLHDDSICPPARHLDFESQTGHICHQWFQGPNHQIVHAQFHEPNKQTLLHAQKGVTEQCRCMLNLSSVRWWTKCSWCLAFTWSHLAYDSGQHRLHHPCTLALPRAQCEPLIVRSQTFGPSIQVFICSLHHPWFIVYGLFPWLSPSHVDHPNASNTGTLTSPKRPRYTLHNTLNTTRCLELAISIN